MAERKKLEVTILPQNFTETQQEQARKNISAAAISATVSKIESSDGTVSAIPYTAEDGSIRYDLKVSAAPVISDTEIYGTNGISAKNQGVKWTIGLSADYLSGNALDNLSGNWESSYDTLKSNSADWLKEDALAGLATKTELNTASSVLTAQTDYLSGVINNKLDTSIFNTYTANADITPYSGIAPIKVEHHTITLTANYALSADVYSKGDVYNKDEIDDIVENLEEQLANLGFHRCTPDEVKSNGEPDEDALGRHGKLSKDLIYLVKDDEAPHPDQYREWIYEDDSLGTVTWTCIGDTTINLEGYATEEWVNKNFSAASALSAEFMKYLIKTDFNTYSAGVKDQIDSKLSTNKFESWSAQAFDDYAKTTDVNDQFNQTSAWAKDTFQPKGEYVSASEFNNLEGIVNDIVEDVTELDNTKLDTSAFNNYSAHALDDYYNKSKVDELVDNAIDGLSATVSSEYAKKTDIHEYTAGPNIEINDYIVSGRDWTPELDEKADTTFVEDIAETLANGIAKKLDTSAFNEYSAHALVDYYKKSETSAKEEIQAALDEKQDNLTEEQLSAISSVSAIQAISGNWVTSATNVIADPDLAYFLVKDGDSSKWNGVDLSTLGKTYEVLSTDDDLLKITSSVDGNNTTYTLSAKDWSDELEEKVDKTTFNEELQDIAEQFVDLSATVSSDYVKKGEIPEPVFYDISAKYAKAQSGTYNDKDYYFISGAEIVGNNGVSAEYDPVTNSWEVGLEEQTYTYAEAQTLLTTLTASTEALSGYTNIVKYGNGIDIDSTDITLDTGLYHVDIQVNIPVETVSNNTYSVSLTSNLSNAIVTHDIDASYIHTETFDLSFDVNALQNSNDLVFSISGLPVGYKYIVKNLQIHQVVTTDTVLDVAGHIYGAGSGVLIDNQYNINVNYDETSGIGLNENNQLVVKLGKGLKFEESGEVAGTLTLDNITEEVVETVTELQTELNGKLTTNFPYPMITDNNTDFANYKGNGDNCICQLFSVSLNHKITTDTYFTVYMKDNGYSQTNVIFGIFEYNFDYWDETAQRWRGQTNWVCDTGPVNLNKPTKDYKLEFPVTHINSAHDVLRSDRAYYAVLALKSDGGNGVFLACTDNYNGDVHSEPTLNWRWQSVPNLDFINASGTLENTYWWDPNVNNYDEKADMRRFFLQIRNKVQPTPNP